MVGRLPRQPILYAGFPLFASPPLSVPKACAPPASLRSFNFGMSNAFDLAPFPGILLQLSPTSSLLHHGAMLALAPTSPAPLPHVNAPTHGCTFQLISSVAFARAASTPDTSVIWYFGRCAESCSRPGVGGDGVLCACDDAVDCRCAVYWLWWAGASGCGRMASQIMARVGGAGLLLGDGYDAVM